PEGMVPPKPRTIIPPMPGVARPRGERRAAMQQAVIAVIRHLVLRAVPPEHRSPPFDQARDLLSEAGWGLGELVAAAGDGARPPGPVPGAGAAALAPAAGARRRAAPREHGSHTGKPAPPHPRRRAPAPPPEGA